MELHERFFKVEKARLAFSTAWLALRQEHELTYAEAFSILGEAIASMAKYAIRTERHPGESKGGDEA